jgi:ubiquitin carboxyl-terminal hydrolase 7
MGEPVEDFQVFSWKLSDYRRLDKRVTSPEFACGGHKWCVVGSFAAGANRTSEPALLDNPFRTCPKLDNPRRLGRNILLFPMGNSNGQANDMVSVYLNYGDQKASEGWHVCAQFALAISNPGDPTVYIQSRASSLPLFRSCDSAAS